MSLTLQDFEYAPDYIKRIAEAEGIEDITSYAFFRVYENKNDLPGLRDRTEEMTRALNGMTGDTDIWSYVFTGKALAQYGYPTTGAAFNQEFKLMFA